MSQPLADAFAAAYPELLRLARSRLAREQASISAVTLVSELYLDLHARAGLDFESRGAFMAYAARAMRSLLVDMARERLADKRGADLLPLTLGHDMADAGQARPEQMLALNRALEDLGRIDERLVRVAEMRAVLGMEVAEVAAALAVSEPTVKRDWQRAKAFLYDALGQVP
jgi:RNA polymerase sigma factor (TIGR02999 family)